MYDTKIQVPINSKVLVKSRRRAKKLGFSSVNDIVRIALQQFADGEYDIGIIPNTKEYRKELDRRIKEVEDDIRMGKSKAFSSAEDLVKALDNEKDILP